MKFASIAALALCLNLFQSTYAVNIRAGRNSSNATSVLVKQSNGESNQAGTVESKGSRQVPSFQEYYYGHTGRGIWKWNVALDMYQRHLSPFANKPAKLVEIGVQSGGSINMYHSVLPNCHYYGLDINKNCVQFNDGLTTITIGDQASVPVWQNFFGSVSGAGVDIVIDDGGHQAHQMLTTIEQALPHLNPAGFFLTEDIHGQNDDYLSKFLKPASFTIMGLQSQTGAQVASVHLYPFILGVQMIGGPMLEVGPARAWVKTLPELTASLAANKGGVVGLANPEWPTLFTPVALQNIMGTFYGIYGGLVRQEPTQCHNGMASNCTMIVTNTPLQDLVKGVHIFPTHIFVEVHATAPTINAQRKGSVWIPYNGP